MRILAIDDNEANLEVLRVMLQACNLTVETATSGEAALAAAAASAPDLVFMDLAMPGGLDGLETTRRLKASPGTAAARVVALTAMVRQNDEQQALEAGCDAFMRKPYLRQDLVSVISRFFPDWTPPAIPSRHRPPASLRRWSNAG